MKNRGIILSFLLICVVMTLNAENKSSRWVEDIRVLSPTPCSEVSGRVKVCIQAKRMTSLNARCYVQDSKSRSAVPQKLDLTPGGIRLDKNGVGLFYINMRRMPHGPLNIQITGQNVEDECDIYELQLYNTGGKPDIAGIPDTIPLAAQGMHMVYSDDFDGPLSISHDGRGSRYNAHKPTFGDFSGWPFSNPEGEQNPFIQRDTYLIIRAQKADGTKGRTGLIATVDMDGNGFRAKPPFYMECRLMAQSAPGTWPAFWTVTNIHKGKGDELDVVEAYGGWGEGNPNSTGYWVTSHFWDQTDKDGQPLKHPGKLIETDAGRLGTSWSQTFHTYGLYVDSLQTTYYLDDEEVWSHSTNSYSYENPHVILINYAIGGASGWKINLERYNNMSEMYVDYLRVYEKR